MSYYNLDSDRVFLGMKGLKSINKDTERIIKKLKYPSVLDQLYLIDQYGILINRVANTIITPTIDEHGFPCMVLSSKDGDEFVREKFRIVDLVAYNFISNSDSYLERGYHASNKNGILTDNYYTNIVYKE